MENNSASVNLTALESVKAFFYPYQERIENKNVRINGLGLTSDPEVIYFHFEEGISIPYSGILHIVTCQDIDIKNIEIEKIYLKVTYQIKNENKEICERTIWGLIKNIIKLESRVLAGTNNTNKNKKNYYRICIESPLARIFNEQNIFSYKKINELIISLLNGINKDKDKDKTIENDSPILVKIDVQNLESLDELNTETLQIQRSNDNTLDFLNKILIGYGINYVFDFNDTKHQDEDASNKDNSKVEKDNEKIKLIFFKKIPICYKQNVDKKDDESKYNTSDWIKECLFESNESYDSDVIHLNNVIFERKAIKVKEIYQITRKLKDNWINFTYNRSNNAEDKSKHTKNIFKNLCLYNLHHNPIISVHDSQDIRLKPGLVLAKKSEFNYLINNVITDLNFNLKYHNNTNAIKIKVSGVEITDHPHISKINDYDLNQSFDFGSKCEIGCLIPDNYFESLIKNSVSNVEIIEAIVCSKDGNINVNSYAEDFSDNTRNNALFYATTDYIGEDEINNVITVYSMTNYETSFIKKVKQGQRILVIKKNGYYFLNGFIQSPVELQCDESEKDSLKIYQLDDESLLSLDGYSSPQDYIFSLLKLGPKIVDSTVMFHALEQGRLDIYDKKFNDLCFIKDENVLIKKCKKFSIARDNYRKAVFEITKNYYTGKTNDIQSEFNKAKNEYNECKDDLYQFAGKIIELFDDLKNKQDKNGSNKKKNVLILNNKDNIKVNAENGDIEISAENIKISASKKLFLHSENIELNASDSIKSHVGLSCVEIKPEGTKISTGTTISCKVPNNSGDDVSDLMSSSFSVATYSGISGSAYNIKFSGANGLSLRGPLKSGISLGYGTVKIVGSEFKVVTQGKFEQYRNIVHTSRTMLRDIIQSCASLKNDFSYQAIGSFGDLAGDLYDNVIDAFQTCSKWGQDWNDAKNVYDYLDIIIQAIYKLIDIGLWVVRKIILKFQTLQYKENIKNGIKDNKPKLMTPFKKNDQNGRLDQAEMYLSHFKMCWSLIGAGFKAYQGAFGFFPSVSSFSINSTATKLSSQNIKFIVSQDAETAHAPSSGCVEHELREKLESKPKDGGLLP